MQAESIVVFPEGIGVIPLYDSWTTPLGEATAAKWQSLEPGFGLHHGLFAAGDSLDETYGLIEVIKFYVDLLARGLLWRSSRNYRCNNYKKLRNTFNMTRTKDS